MSSQQSAWALCLVLAASARGQEELGPLYVARTPPLPPEEERLKFKLPPGFEAQLVAAEPDIRKPMNLAFDDRGRLWATESVEYPFPAKDGAEGRDCVKVFEDTDGDGNVDRVTRFAEDLNIPIGLLPLPDGAIVHSISRDHSRKGMLFRFRDVDGDGKADERRELFGAFGFRDTHGMINGLRLALDGWIYACHGFSNDSEVKGTDGHAFRMNSGNTWRMRPDGSRAEQFTHGQVNPFGLAFDPLMNLYSADCHSQPGYQLLRGAYYPSFGKPHDGLGFGPVMMPHDHGSSGIAGIVYYAADQFPEEYQGTVFLGNVMTNRVNHDRLEWRGSTPRAVQNPDFLASEDPWFRPVDLQIGPEGALYVADFYNRIIGHYEVPLTHPGRDRERGRIWRIVYRGKEGRGAGPRPPIADFGRAGTDELVALLGHPNIQVRTRATHALVRKGAEAVEPIRIATASATAGPFTKMHGLWALERLEALDLPAVKAAAADPEAGVRVHLQRVLSERARLGEAERDLALAALKDPDASVRRAAADALGRHPHPGSLKPLVELRKATPAEDGQLIHVARMALRDHLRKPECLALLRSPEEVEDLLDVIPGVHSPASASLLLKHLAGSPRSLSPERVQYAARYLPEEERATLHALVRAIPPGDVGRRAAAVGALQRGAEERGGKLDEETMAFASEVAGELLASGDGDRVRRGIELARSLKLKPLRERLAAVASAKPQSEENRRLALEALVAMDPAGQVQLLGAVLSDASEPLSLREHAARQLGDIGRPEAMEALAVVLRAAPARLESRIAASMARTREGGEKLIEEVSKGKASARVLTDQEVARRLGRIQAPEVKERLEALTRGLPEVDERIVKLIESRKAGYAKAKSDAARGAAVFEKTCAPCHRLGEKGARIGPDLAGIGLRGVDRLLEDTLDPGRNVDQAFHTTVLVLKDGLLRSGLLLRDEPELIVLADQEGKEVRVPKSDVKSRELTGLSPMPSNIAENLPEGDLHDLLRFLLDQREKPEPPR